ncbi:hypothetical protein [Pantoea sp. paga]|uniref:hypothetical protein n=1 Tax=Pantoea sp. paga TaxID=2597519 RepID=UPI001180A86D|nr:hypothetical protein [Pantoea sp. paga]TSH77815.1 hypothetical protein FOV68_23760 [Pantoea sp. paga]
MKFYHLNNYKLMIVLNGAYMNINPNYSLSTNTRSYTIPYENEIFSVLQSFSQGTDLDELSREARIPLYNFFTPMGDYTANGRDFYNSLGSEQKIALDNAIERRRNTLNSSVSHTGATQGYPSTTLGNRSRPSVSASASRVMRPPQNRPSNYIKIMNIMPRFSQGIDLDVLSREIGVELWRYFEPMGDRTVNGNEFYNSLPSHDQEILDNSIRERRNNLNNPTNRTGERMSRRRLR